MENVKRYQVINGHKVCTKCNELLPVDNFPPTDKIKSGFTSRCYSCCYEKKLPSSKIINGGKFCTKCNLFLPVEKFKENKKIKSGLHSWCIDCCTPPPKIKEPKVIIPKHVKEPKVEVPRIVDGKCVCNVCGTLKPIEEFPKNKSKKYGIELCCRVCKNKRCRENYVKYNYRERYREQRREHEKMIQERNRIIREQKKSEKRQKEEQEKLLKRQQKEENRKLKLLEKEERRQRRIELEIYRQTDEYKELQRIKKRQQKMSQHKKRWDNDPLFRFRKKLCTNIYLCVIKRGYTKKSRTHDILGCSFEEFVKYFESLFKPGMTWDNHGEWHIDHIIPISKGNSEEEIIKLCHYTNLQPLWAEENILKGDSIISPNLE